jgi:hypothetical protein
MVDPAWQWRRVLERMVGTHLGLSGGCRSAWSGRALACLPPQRCRDEALSGSMEEAGGARR